MGAPKNYSHITPTDIANGIKYHVSINQRMNTDLIPNIYNTINSNSGYWDSVYTTVNSNSSNWGGGLTGNYLTISSFQSYSGSINPSLLNADSVYTTVQSNSSSWGGGLTGSYVSSSEFQSYSGGITGSLYNADSVYTTVNSNSSNWNTGVGIPTDLTGRILRYIDTSTNFTSGDSDKIVTSYYQYSSGFNNTNIDNYLTNLIEYWKFEEVSGNRIGSVNNYIATPVGSITRVTGKKNYGFYNNINGLYGVTISKTSIDIANILATNNWTINFWGKFIYTSGGYNRILGSANTSTNAGIELVFAPDNSIYIVINNTQTISYPAFSTNYNMFTFKCDSTGFHYYINGVLVDSTVLTNPIENSGYDFGLGYFIKDGSPNSGGGSNSETFDEFSIFNTSLEDAAISALYNSGTGRYYGDTFISVKQYIKTNTKLTDDILNPLNSIYTNVQTNSAYWNRNDINNDQTDSYQLQLSDAGKTIWMNKNTANTLTIPTNLTVNFPVNTTIVIVSEGTGTTTIDAVATVTLNGVSGGSGVISGQYKAVQLINRSTDTWIAIGAIGPVT